MSNQRIAARYAKPLLDLADEKKVLEQVRADMENFVRLCDEERDFLLMLRSPIIPHLKKAEILHKIFDGKSHKLTLSVIDIITRKNRENLLPEIAKEFVRQYNAKMGYVDATVTTTFPLDNSLRGSFEKMVAELTGNTPRIQEEVDKEILGGYILRMEDRQLDESVRSHLNEIKLKFNKN